MNRGYLFDWDDTLVQTRRCRFIAIQELGRRHYGLSITNDHILQHWGKPFPSMFAGVFSTTEENAKPIIEKYLEISEEFPMVAYDDAVPTIINLTAQYPVGIVTASGRCVVEPDLARLGFPVKDFACIQCADDSDFHKPDPRVFEVSLLKFQQLSICKEDITYIGDSQSDFLAASAAGLRFIGIARDGESLKRFQELGATSVPTLAKLK